MQKVVIDFLKSEMSKRNTSIKQLARLHNIDYENLKKFFKGKKTLTIWKIERVISHWGYELKKYLQIENETFDFAKKIKEIINEYGVVKTALMFGTNQTTLSRIKKYLSNLDNGSMPSDLKMTNFLNNFFGKEVKIFYEIKIKT